MTEIVLPSPPARPLTVWIFGDLPLHTACGPSYLVESWSRELERHGLRVRLFTPSGTRERSREERSVTFRTIRNFGFHGDHSARFSSLLELRRARHELPDVILATTPGRLGGLATLVAARYRVPLVVVESTDVTGAMRHYNPVRMLLSGGLVPVVLSAVSPAVRRAIGRRVRLHARRLLSVPALAEVWAEAMRAGAAEVILLSPKMLHTPPLLPALPAGADAAPRSVIPVGIDRLPQTGAPAELAWRPGALRVLCVGRLQPEKNPLLLVDAAALALAGGVDLHLAFVGGGQLAGVIAERAERLGIADRVTVAGPFPRGMLGGVYASADVFAFPSVIETQAFVLNEAAHEGLPLLVSDRDVNPVVRDGESALVVPPDPRAYAEALARLRDPLLRARLGAEAQVRAGTTTEPAQTGLLAQVLHRAGRGPRATGTGGTARGVLRPRIPAGRR